MGEVRAPRLQQEDPHPYHGPIARIDGKRPYNHFLWPMDADSFWSNRDMDGHHRYRSMWLKVVALNDGRWSTTGFVYSMDEATVFATRDAALRSAARTLIIEIRAARKWSGFDRLSNDDAIALITWVRGVVAKETGKSAPESIAMYYPPVPKPKVGLPLFDIEVRA